MSATTSGPRGSGVTSEPRPIEKRDSQRAELSQAHAEPRTPEQAPAAPSARRVMLIGPDATALKARISSGFAVETAESFLEAVLMITPDAASETIFAGVSQEIDQLEQAVVSLRKVAPKSKLYLFCDASDEPLCRKARAWGADDYFVLPISKGTIERLLTPPRQARKSPAECLGEPVQLQVAQLPLVVDTVLATDLLAGRADFVQRAVATLQAYMQWHGRLRFDSQLPEGPADPDVCRATVSHQDLTFGVLTLTNGTDSERSLLGQAATWLGGWMALAHRNEQLRTLAITDELSGAYNRRYFGRFTASLLERARVERFRVSVMLFDIDNFKQYNDKFGHASGDAIIRETIRLLRTCTRPHDLVARLGGDEFAVVFWDNEAPRQPGSQHPKDAIAATERFRAVVASHDWCKGCNIQGEVSISGGLATFPWDGDTVDVLLAKADAALLKAKAAGKNAIVLHEGECSPSV